MECGDLSPLSFSSCATGGQCGLSPENHPARPGSGPKRRRQVAVSLLSSCATGDKCESSPENRLARSDGGPKKRRQVAALQRRLVADVFGVHRLCRGHVVGAGDDGSAVGKDGELVLLD